MEKFPMLSPRERQVCARTAVGMTSEATALDLGVGIGSVQTYRKRAFQRLEISTAFQLAHCRHRGLPVLRSLAWLRLPELR